MNNKHLLFLPVFLTLLLTVCAGKSSVADKSLQDISFLNHVPATPYAENDVLLETLSGKTAFDYFKDEKIYSGWNLGNTLDSYSDEIAGETTWGNPSINQEIMNGIKAAGFDIIRIPVTWMGHIGRAPDYRVGIYRLSRVADVVEMARDAGLKAIINVHHDGSTPSQDREDGWLSVAKSYKSVSEYNRITSQFARLWEQVAIYFRDYGDWLMFESMNEIHDGGWGWSDAFRMFPNQQLDIVNKWNQIFTDVVRATGGNNAERYVIIPAYCTNPGQTLSDVFVLPADTASGKQVVTFHYYDPSQFGIEGKIAAWGTPTEKQKVDNDFAPFKARYIDNGIPVIIGETGAVMQLYPNDATKEAQARQSRRDYIQTVFTTAKKYGLVPIYWDNGLIRGNGEKFGLFNRRTGQPNSEDSSALITIMINAVK